MFSPVIPILPATRPDESARHVVERVEALQTALAALSRLAGAPASPDVHGLDRHAALSSALADMDNQRMAHMARELDAIAAALQAGFLAIDKARKQGHAAKAAARLLDMECRDAMAAALAGATQHRMHG